MPARPDPGQAGDRGSVLVPLASTRSSTSPSSWPPLRTPSRWAASPRIVLVDDGSTDPRGRGDPRPRRRPPRSRWRPRHRRLPRAEPGHRRGWKSRARAARQLVATIDADLEYQPEDLLRLRRELYEHSVDRGAGAGGSAPSAREDENACLSREARALLNRRRPPDGPLRQQAASSCARPRGLRGSLHVPRQLLLLAVVRDGGGAGRGYSYKQGEVLLPTAPPGDETSSKG